MLLHDGLLDRRVWDDQFVTFARHYRTIRYDRRGYGNSSVPDRPFSDTSDLHRLLRHLDINEAYLLGMSNGGMTGTKIRSFSPLPRNVSLKDLVPKVHFYRRLGERLDLSFVRELVEDHANPSLLCPTRLPTGKGSAGDSFLAQEMGVYPDGGRRP